MPTEFMTVEQCPDGGCCIPPCVPPVCTLTGERTGELGDDVVLTWTSTGTTTVVIDSDGNVISTALNGSATIYRGACKTYTLTTTNECDTDICTYEPEARETCDCTECPYEDEYGEHPNPQPASICVPCGCARGRGTSMALTIAGFPSSFQDGPVDVKRLYHATSCPPAHYECGADGTIVSYQWERTWKWLDYDVLNGTYVFDLLDQDCPTCGARRCGVSPSGYYVGTASIELKSASLYPPCDSRYTSPTTDYIEIEFCVGLVPPQTTAPYYPSDLTCQNLGGASPKIYSRVTSQPAGAGLSTAWISTEIGSTYAGTAWDVTPDDDCDYSAVPAKEPALPEFYPVWLGPCTEYDGPLYYHFPKEFDYIISPGSPSTDVVRWVFGYYDSWDVSYTTEGW